MTKSFGRKSQRSRRSQRALQKTSVARKFLIDELSGGCVFGLCAALGATAPVEKAVRNTNDLVALASRPIVQIFRDADVPFILSSLVELIPRFYRIDGRVGMDFRVLPGTGESRPALKRTRQIS